jgi:hypothetical protein
VQRWSINSARRRKPGKSEILDIDDAFCAAHGGQQLAFWNAHHDERGFASMHIHHVGTGTPVAAILRPARTPKGTEVRTVIEHASKQRLEDFPCGMSPAGALPAFSGCIRTLSHIGGTSQQRTSVLRQT